MATSNSNLLIIGDSFVAEDNGKHYEWAWWNRLAKDSNSQPINLAITGASNFNIWHQLEYAYKNCKFNKILIVLTAPNRIENINTPVNEVITYEHFKNKDITSWAVHDRLAQGELTAELVDTYFDFKIAESKDRIIAESILHSAERRPCVILPNLFTGFTRYHFNIIREACPVDYSDVTTGVLDEPEIGHIHKSWHDKFYNKHKELFLAKLD